ncbi:MAG: DEAD/DEAH box helicase [Limnochordia bacterium]|jgi:DEAD/DEAH box helicase domain-containing protein|nr:DEAD/DEAH box helicase [Bacillota bacterium]
MNVEGFLKEITSRRDYRGQVKHVHHLPPSPPRYGSLERPLPDLLANALERLGINGLYSHQVQAINFARRGQHVVVATGTASGKTLCYNLPVMESLLEEGATALYLFPTKALAQDQLQGLLRWQGEGLPINCGTYDGDTPRNSRSRLREEGNVILTNPDMLHGGIMPHHPTWARFFSGLRYVVIDEIHVYRGIFGSHMANVLRRLDRILAYYGASPVYICCSATIANPLELAAELTGKEMALVDDDGSARGGKWFVLWNPPRIEETGLRRSSNSEAKDLMVQLIRGRHQVIGFTRTRMHAELLYRYVREELTKESPSLAKMVRAYRGGYLPSERRNIEELLFKGELLGVASTNALELGIDIGSLDAALIVGFPGSIASVWQQAGRAGRGTEDSLAVLIAHDLPIDQFLMENPSYFFGRSPENAVIDKNNPYIVLGHLRAAAYELPIHVDEELQFGPSAPALLDILAEDRQLLLSGDKWYWRGRTYPADDFSLRNISDATYTIIRVKDDGPEVIGSMDELSAFTQLYEEAVYIHDGEVYVVEKLDVDQRVAYVRMAPVDYYTQAITERKVQVLHLDQQRTWGQSTLCYGEVGVSFLTYMFKKIKFNTRENIGYGKVHLPLVTLETGGCWLIPPREVLRKVQEYGRSPMEGLLGVANVMGEVATLLLMCDGSDIDTIVDATNTGLPSIFLVDRYPGGIGLAQKAYQLMEELLRASLDIIKGCPCLDGCPSCVGAPLPPAQLDTDSRGRIPDKEAALVILHRLLGLEDYVPKAPVQRHETVRERPPAPPLSAMVERGIRRQLKRWEDASNR